MKVDFVFEILEIDDESEEYFLNGEYLDSANHDEDGWAGMSAKRELIKKIAEKIGARVVQN